MATNFRHLLDSKGIRITVAVTTEFPEVNETALDIIEDFCKEEGLLHEPELLAIIRDLEGGE